METEKIARIIDNFKGKKIGVIGDLMLDQFIFGDTERLSPEAPVPVVVFSKEIYTLGGAANTAHNIASLGGDVFLVGVIGKDTGGSQVLKQLKNIGSKGVVVLKDRQTTHKTRIVSQGQHIVRLDKEQSSAISKEAEKKIISVISANIKNWDIVLISDYNKGVVTPNVIANILKLAKKNGKKVIADVKPANAQYFKNVFLLVPNQKEAFLISGSSDAKTAGKIIQKNLQCNVLVKQGADGMTLFENNKTTSFPAKAKEVFDVSGAGDTVLATLSLALCAGADLKEAAMIANHAAGISVGKVGTATVLPEELKEDLLS